VVERAKAEPFPWDDALGFLMGTLGWSPQTAWATTLPELRLAYEGRYGRTSSNQPGRAALSALIVAFPDIPKNEAA
jgi:uncharacterized phage protein (TIGR02216 family)